METSGLRRLPDDDVAAYVGLSTRSLAQIGLLQGSASSLRTLAARTDAHTDDLATLPKVVGALIQAGLLDFEVSRPQGSRKTAPSTTTQRRRLETTPAPAGASLGKTSSPATEDASSASYPHGLWDVRQVAEYLGIARKTFYNWRVEGRGPEPITMGTTLRWRRADVDQWIETQRNRK